MKDIKGYIEKLDKSMTKKEKLFFLNKVKLSSYDYIVDFGCANGRLLYEIDQYLTKKTNRRDIELIGIDNNKDINIAYNYTQFFTKLNSIESVIDLKDIFNNKAKVLLIFSSVIHELDIDTLAQITVFAERYVDTIVIRDMAFEQTRLSRLVEMPSFYFLCDKITKQLRDYDNNKYSYIFTKTLKMIDGIDVSPASINFFVMYEFFMKYTYSDNWETEKDEEYPSNGKLQLFINSLANSNLFRLKYHKRYILPYKKKEVYKQFGYKMYCNTHIKLIFERKKVKKFRGI